MTLIKGCPSLGDLLTTPSPAPSSITLTPPTDTEGGIGKTNTGYSIAIPTNHKSFHSSTWVRMTASCQVHRQEDGGQCPELPLSKELTAFGDEVPK